MTGLSLLLVGQIHEPSPWGAAGWAAGYGNQLRRAADPRAAAALLVQTARPPEVIVLAESRPGAFADASILALRRLAPLARVWRLLGSWCEGEPRSGHPPSGCTSTYWHQWQARWAQALDDRRMGHCPAWALPVTLSPEERTMAAAERPLPRGTGLIAICSRQAQMASALADACRSHGYATSIVSQRQLWDAAGARAVLWDAAVEQLTDRDAVRDLRAQAGGAPLLALVDFPRAEDCLRAAEAGIAGVISRPFLLDDLLWHLAGVADGQPV
jgi:CheY-like chemotaxis protein